MEIINMTYISEKDLEEWYPISRKEFRAWLESKEGNVVVGQSIVYGNDPVATAINEKENEWETAIIDSEMSRTTFNGWMKVDNPRWVNRFIEKIDRDTLEDEPVNITAKQALKVLTEVEEERGKAIDTERLQEIEKAKEMFLTDSYSMSVGELLLLHADGQLTLSSSNVHISVTQQNEFIESIFLDLPSQPLFVKQDSNGRWKVLSGSWMLKSILNFLDENEDDRLVLRATDLLPCLYGLTWNDLSDREKFQFKRFTFKVHILAEHTEDTFWKDRVSSIFRRYSSYGY
jgi:hypothetical protein